MQFGMPTLIENKTLEENAYLCRELKLDFIEINMNMPQYQAEVMENTKDFTEIAEEYNIYYTIHLDENMNVCDFNSGIAKAYLDTVKQTIEIAKKLKIPVLNMHMNEGVHFTLPDRKVYLFEQYNENYMSHIKNYRKMCEKAIGGEEIKISIENTEGYHAYEKKAIEYLLESPVFTLTWDIGHSHGTGNADEAFLMKHEEKLHHFHIHDGKGTKNHLTLGSGEIDLKQRLQIAQKHNCRCVIETKTIASLKESVKWLRAELKS